MKTYKDFFEAVKSLLQENVANHNEPRSAVDGNTVLALIGLFDSPEQRELEKFSATVEAVSKFGGYVPPMTLLQYQDLANRTISPEGHQHFFTCRHAPGMSVAEMAAAEQIFNIRIGYLHALSKLSEEIGELWGPVNKALWYGKPMGPKEIENMKEEAGDLLWYIAGPFCRALGCSLEEVARMNAEKLAARYPERYTDADALSRKDKQTVLPLSPSPDTV